MSTQKPELRGGFSHNSLNLEATKMPLGWGKDKLWPIRTVDHSSALKTNNTLLNHEQTWRKLERAPLRDRRQPGKAKSCLIPTL